MKNKILLELACGWERQATDPVTQDGSEKAKLANAFAAGERQGKKTCANQLILLISLLPGTPDD